MDFYPYTCVLTKTQIKMKKTKSILLSAIITIAVTFAVIISSCTKSEDNTTYDPCASVTCLNGGTCSGGICHCPSGYTGTRCETPPVVSKGYLYIENGSTNPYNVYVNGSLWITLDGGYYVNYPLPPATYTVRVIQQSGYISYPTDKTYVKTVTSLNVSTVYFP